MADDDYSDFVRAHYERNASQIVTALHALADRVEQTAIPAKRSSATGTPPYLYAAQQVQHELVWGMANLSAYHLIGTAYAVDAANQKDPS